MVLIGFHASHEQVHPRVLLDDAVHAERAGFDAVMCSDHLAPWTQAQGHSGFTWTWLGAALQATRTWSPRGSSTNPYLRTVSPVSLLTGSWVRKGPEVGQLACRWPALIAGRASPLDREPGDRGKEVSLRVALM